MSQGPPSNLERLKVIVNDKLCTLETQMHAVSQAEQEPTPPPLALAPLSHDDPRSEYPGPLGTPDCGYDTSRMTPSSRLSARDHAMQPTMNNQYMHHQMGWEQSAGLSQLKRLEGTVKNLLASLPPQRSAVSQAEEEPTPPPLAFTPLTHDVPRSEYPVPLGEIARRTQSLWPNTGDPAVQPTMNNHIVHHQMSWEPPAGLSQLDRLEETVENLLASMAPRRSAMSQAQEEPTPPPLVSAPLPLDEPSSEYPGPLCETARQTASLRLRAREPAMQPTMNNKIGTVEPALMQNVEGEKCAPVSDHRIAEEIHS